jgi:uncharacterized YccA/Bax inhibitor family protein
MEFNKTSNPIFGQSATANIKQAFGTGEVMTLNGTVNKTFILLLAVAVSASFAWKQAFASEGIGAAAGLMTFGAIGGLIAALVTVFKKEWAAVTAPIYAILQGLFVGGLSAVAESMYPGLVMQAVALTIGVFVLMLFAYRTEVIKPTKKFMMGVFAATGAVALIYLVSMVLGMFGVQVPMIHSNGPIGIIFSLVVVTIAALNLILDFKFIEDGSKQSLPKYMEWYGAFGLMVTLIWLYIEIVRLLMKLQSRD